MSGISVRLRYDGNFFKDNDWREGQEKVDWWVVCTPRGTKLAYGMSPTEAWANYQKYVDWENER